MQVRAEITTSPVESENGEPTAVILFTLQVKMAFALLKSDVSSLSNYDAEANLRVCLKSDCSSSQCTENSRMRQKRRRDKGCVTLREALKYLLHSNFVRASCAGSVAH